MALKRAISVSELCRKKFKLMDFEGKFKASFGKPELGGSWLVWGNSANGKTSLCMQLAKYLTQFGKVAYNSFEEGVSMSFQNTILRNNMQEVAKRFNILDGESFDELTERLKRRNAPSIIIIDSVQHSKMTREEYTTMKHNHPNKLFIYVSHARGKLPKGEVADFVRFDADLKIWVEGFRAFVDGRLNEAEGVFYDVYPEKSAKHWQEVD